MATRTFEVSTTRTQVFEEGWGVAVTPIYSGDEPEYVDERTRLAWLAFEIAYPVVTEGGTR
jgi:hypothetical protein